MAGEEDTFLEALKSDTQESDTREVYADWLEEQGQHERAEYLRLEVEVRSYDFITGDPERVRKKKRRDELEDQLSKKDPDWVTDVSRVARPNVQLPRPTDVGRAEPIPAKAKPAEPEAPETFSLPGPLDLRALPPLPVAKRSILPSIAIGIALGLGLISLITDMRKPHFWERMIERIYEHNR